MSVNAKEELLSHYQVEAGYFDLKEAFQGAQVKFSTSYDRDSVKS